LLFFPALLCFLALLGFPSLALRRCTLLRLLALSGLGEPAVQVLTVGVE